MDPTLSLTLAPVAVASLLAAWWVRLDSLRRGTDPAIAAAWALGTFFLSLPAYLAYLALRDDARFNGPRAFADCPSDFDLARAPRGDLRASRAAR